MTDMAKCVDGTHVHELIEDAIRHGHAYVTLTDTGDPGITVCGRGNGSSWGRMLQRLAQVAEEDAGLTQCPMCKAHMEGIRAALAAYEATMEKAGLLVKGQLVGHC